MTLGTRLKSLRTDNRLTQLQMGKLIGLSESTIGMYENNRREPSIDILKAYSQYFEVPLDYLLGNTLSQKITNEYTTINVYGRVPAGIPIEAIDDIQDTEDISFKDGYAPSKDYMGLIVDGDSMYPDYLKGDTIIIEVTPDCESGEDCVVYINGYDATLKTVIKNSDGSITLKPINPEYPPVTYGPNDEPIKILGVVREIRRKRKRR